jgi:hypothetical protein
LLLKRPDRQDSVGYVSEFHGTARDRTEHRAPGLRPQPWLVDANSMDAGDLAGLDVLEGGEQGRMAAGRKFRMVWFDMPCRQPPPLRSITGTP